jgi:glycosyltransferase involved in cell wall biosynthesis
MTLISIVVPVYRSEEIVHELCSAVDSALKNVMPYELILVNDQSPDKSWEKIKEAATANPNVTGINLRKNFGQDGAIMAGLKISKGDYVVIMDDDLQHNPADIPKLYEACKQGYDVCYANFRHKQQKSWKNAGSWLNSRLSEKLLNKPRELYLSPFKIINRPVIDEVVKFTGPYPYLDATILTITSKLTQIDIEHHKRLKGSGNYNFVKSAIVFVNHATNYSIYPLRLVTITGFTVSIISAVMGIGYIIDYFYGNTQKVEGWITITILLIFFGGLILMCLGLIGEYIGRIFMSINGKPQYVIDSIVKQEKH